MFLHHSPPPGKREARLHGTSGSKEDLGRGLVHSQHANPQPPDPASHSQVVSFTQPSVTVLIVPTPHYELVVYIFRMNGHIDILSTKHSPYFIV